MRKTERGTTFVFFRPTHLHDETKTAPLRSLSISSIESKELPRVPLSFLPIDLRYLSIHPPSRSNSNEYQELESFWKKERKRENMQIAFIISGFPGDSEEIEMEILRSSRAFFFTLILWLLKSCRSMRF